MNIRTRYDVGDDIWAIVDDKVRNLLVSEIRIAVSPGIRIEYVCYYVTNGAFSPTGSNVVHYFKRHEFILSEDRMFKDKKSLLKSL